jgi:hypothetical protein
MKLFYLVRSHPCYHPAKVEETSASLEVVEPKAFQERNNRLRSKDGEHQARKLNLPTLFARAERFLLESIEDCP